MYSLEIAYLVMLEQRADRIRAAEQAQLLEAAGYYHDSNNTFKLTIAWLGRLLKALGTKLEQFGDTTSTQRALEL